MRTVTADEYWDPLTPEESQAFERLRDVVRRYLRDTRVVRHDPSARLEIVAAMIVVEDAHARINRAADQKSTYASFAEIPESPFANYVEDVRTTYREILPKLIRTSPFVDSFGDSLGCASTIWPLRNKSGDFSPPWKERDQRFWRDWWREAAVELDPGFDEEHFRASLVNDAIVGSKARADGTAAGRAADSALTRFGEPPASGADSPKAASLGTSSPGSPGQAPTPDQTDDVGKPASPARSDGSSEDERLPQKTAARRLGVSRETLRKALRDAGISEGERSGRERLYAFEECRKAIEAHRKQPKDMTPNTAK